MDLWTGVVICLCLSYPDTSLSDLSRFPTYDVCHDAVAFNRTYELWLRDQKDLRIHHADWFADALKENHQLWWVWDSLLYARNEGNSESCRVQWLRELRRCLGEEAWAAGQMPPCVPVWRYSQR